MLSRLLEVVHSDDHHVAYTLPTGSVRDRPIERKRRLSREERGHGGGLECGSGSRSSGGLECRSGSRRGKAGGYTGPPLRIRGRPLSVVRPRKPASQIIL